MSEHSEPLPSVVVPARSWLRDPDFPTAAWHVCILSGLVLAQPALERLAANVTYIIEQGLTATALLVIAAATLLIPAAVLVGLEGLAVLVRPGCQRWIHRVILAGLAFLEGGLISRWFGGLDGLRQQGVIDFAQLAIMLGTAASLWWLYFTRAWVWPLLNWAALGLVLFPVVFLGTCHRSGVLFPSREKPVVKIGNPVPTVMLVFDGLAGTALMDENRQIDRVRYPNFARLADKADWFRNATTVHSRTDHALPAMLSGEMPTDGTEPILAEYPQNLLALVHNSQVYGMTVFEPLTRLTPPELEIQPLERSLPEQVSQTLAVLARVYLKISLPENFAGDFMPSIPLAWFSLSKTNSVNANQLDGLLGYTWDSERSEQIQHFVASLRPTEQPHFWFGHFALPHYPFRYFPDGTAYDEEIRILVPMWGANGFLGEDWGTDELATDLAWQRYLLQVGYVDRRLGQVLDRLEATGLLDSSLLIVTSDHGCSFRPGQSLRVPSAETIPDLMPIALFVKRPGQTTGSIQDRNVESIDIFPTVVEALQLDCEVPEAAESVYAPQPARLRKTLVAPGGNLQFEGTFPQGDLSLQRMLQRFGSGHDDRFWSLCVRPELLGQQVSEFPVAEGTRRLSLYEATPNRQRTLLPEPIDRGYLSGRVLDEFPDQPVVLAAAVDGRIVGVTRTLNEPNWIGTWELLLPPGTIGDDQTLELWEVLTEGETTQLRRCRLVVTLH